MIELKGIEDAIRRVVGTFAESARSLAAPHVVYRAVCKQEEGNGWVARSPQFPKLLGNGPFPEAAMRAFDNAVRIGESWFCCSSFSNAADGRPCNFFPEAP